MKISLLFSMLFAAVTVLAQDASISGKVSTYKKPVAYASVILNKYHAAVTDSAGNYFIAHIKPGKYWLSVSFTGMTDYTKMIVLTAGQQLQISVTLEEKAGMLNEVVVTGVAGSSKIKNTPVAAAVVSKKELQNSTNTNIIDALVKAIPGISAVTTGPNISKPFIRGLGYNRVLTMYDGVRQEGQQWGDEHGIEMDQYGITRAEVVKGPASLSYGSDAVAGAVNLIPAFPADNNNKLNGDALLEYQSNNSLIGGSIGLSQKVKNVMWVARGSAKTAADYKNTIDGRVYATGFKELNFSAMAGIEKQSYKTYVYATTYNNLQEIPDGSRDSLTRQFTYQVKEIGEDDIKNRPVVPGDALAVYTITPLHQHILHYRLYNKTTIKTAAGELNTLIGFQQNTRQEFNHPAKPSQAGLDVHLTTLNYEIRFGFAEWKGIGFTTGINGMYQNNKNKDATDFPIPDYRLFDIGTYILAKKDVGKFSLSGGIRYDHRQVKWDDFYVTINSSTGFAQQVKGRDTIGAELRYTANRQAFKGVSASAGFTCTFSDRIYMKVNIARGYRAPNITETAANGLDPGAHIYYIGSSNFIPETNWQEDAGFFYSDKNVQAGVEVFNNQISNYIFLQKILNEDGQPLQLIPGNTTYEYKQASARLYGLEASVTLQPQAYKWCTLKNSAAIITGLNKDEELTKTFGNKAKYLPLIPPLHTVSTLHIALPVQSKNVSDVYAQAELEYYARQNKLYAVDNTETATAGYNLVNIGSGITIRNKKGSNLCRVIINANNIFNTAYQSHLSRLKYFEYYRQSLNGYTGIYNMGRNISIKSVFSF